MTLFGAKARAQAPDVAFRLEQTTLQDSTLRLRIVREGAAGVEPDASMPLRIRLLGDVMNAATLTEGGVQYLVVAILADVSERRVLRIDRLDVGVVGIPGNVDGRTVHVPSGNAADSGGAPTPALQYDGRAGRYARYTLRVPVVTGSNGRIAMLDSAVLSVGIAVDSGSSPRRHRSIDGATAAIPRSVRVADTTQCAAMVTTDGGIFRLTRAQLEGLGLASDTLRGVVIRTAREELFDESIPLGDSVSLPITPIDFTERSGHLDDVTFFIPPFTKWRINAFSLFPYHQNAPYRSAISTTMQPMASQSSRLSRRASVADGVRRAAQAAYGLAVHEYDSVNMISLTGESGYMMAGTSYLGELLGSGETPRPQSRTITIPLMHAASSGTLHVSIMTAHRGNEQYADVQLGESFVVIGGDTLNHASMEWRRSSGDPFGQYSTYVTLPMARLANDTLRITLGQEVYDGRPTFLDWIEVAYPQRPLLDGRPVDCWTSGAFADSALRIEGGRESEPPICLDITHPEHPVVVVPAWGDGAWSIQDTSDLGAAPRRYYVAEQTKDCDHLTITRFRDMRTGSTPSRLLVITTRALENIVTQRLRERYADDVAGIGIATVDDIFNTYSAGNLDPLAIREFIREQYDTTKNDDLHVLLVGDASCDFRDVSGYGGQGVIAYQYDSPRGRVNATAAADDYYVCVSGADGIPDLPIGRLPARTPEEADRMLSDATEYPRRAAGPWLARSIFAADNNWPDYSKLFSSARSSDDAIGAMLPPHVMPRKVYLSFYQDRWADAQADLLWDWRKGARTVYWDGHGNPDVWAHEHLLDTKEPLNVGDAFPPFVTALTCNFGFFDDPRHECGAERLLRGEKDRVAGVITSTRPLLNIDGESLQPPLLSAMHDFSSPAMTIGRALLRAKWFDPLNAEYPGVVLLGDPTLPLRTPTRNIEISHVDGVPVLGEDVVVRGGAVTLTGLILGDSVRWSSGNVFVTVYTRVGDTAFSDYGLPISVGRESEEIVSMTAELHDGRFTVRIPMPLCAPDTAMRVSIQAVAVTDDLAASTVLPLTIHRSDAFSPGADMLPPKVSLTFQPPGPTDTAGTMVLTVQDTSGVVLPNVGSDAAPAWQLEGGEWRLIPRRQATWEDGNTRSVVLRVPMPDFGSGYHHFRVRLGDLACNVLLVDSLLPTDIPSNGEGIAVRAFPNPAAREVRIRLAHSALPGADLHWRLFNVRGQVVGEGHVGGVCCAEAEIEMGPELVSGLASGMYVAEVAISPRSGVEIPRIVRLPLLLMR